MKKIYYIGSFPGKTGGVTIKNREVFAQLEKKVPINKIDLSLLRKCNIRTILGFLAAVIGDEMLIVAASARLRRLLSGFLYTFNRRTLRQSVLLVMGGTFARTISADAPYRKWVKCYKCIYVETEIMKRVLESCGVTNVEVFPNCRSMPSTEIKVNEKGEKLKCLAFSLITPDKGADVILQAAEELPDILFDFYGEVDKEYQHEFERKVETLPNCKYLGILKATEQEKYKILNEYDVFLFPTRCDIEGVPGALIESKIAAITAVVSDVAYNAELVAHGVDGLVLENNDVAFLVDALRHLDSNPSILYEMKKKAGQSGENYYFDKYVQSMVQMLSDR